MKLNPTKYISGVKTGAVKTYNAVRKSKLGQTASNITCETLGTGSYYKNNIITRWKAGKKVAKKQEMGNMRTFGTQIKSIATGMHYKKEHLPTLLGLACFPTPIPCIAGYGVGKVLNKIFKLFQHKK